MQQQPIEAIDDMPRELPHDTRLFAEIMDRHDVTRKAIAIDAGVQPEHMSRCLGGQYAMPMNAWRALWALTNDPDIPRILFGGDDYIVVPMPDASRGNLERQFATYATRVMTKDWRDHRPGQIILRLIQAALQLMRAHGADDAVRSIADGRAA